MFTVIIIDSKYIKIKNILETYQEILEHFQSLNKSISLILKDLHSSSLKFLTNITLFVSAIHTIILRVEKFRKRHCQNPWKSLKIIQLFNHIFDLQFWMYAFNTHRQKRKYYTIMILSYYGTLKLKVNNI